MCHGIKSRKNYITNCFGKSLMNYVTFLVLFFANIWETKITWEILSGWNNRNKIIEKKNDVNIINEKKTGFCQHNFFFIIIYNKIHLHCVSSLIVNGFHLYLFAMWKWSSIVSYSKKLLLTYNNNNKILSVLLILVLEK